MRLVKPLKWLRELIGILIAGLIVVTVLFIWRLSLGPVKIDFLRPLIERTLSAETKSAIRFDNLWLSWHGFERPLQIEISNLAILDDKGQPAVQADHGEVRVASRSLFIGHLRPVGATLVHPQLRVIRLDDGSFSLGLGNNNAPLSLRQLINDIRNPAPNSVFSHWSDFGIRDAIITAETTDHRVFAEIDQTNLLFTRNHAGLEADFTAVLKNHEIPATLSASLTSDPVTGMLTVKSKIDNITISRLSAIDPLFTECAGIDIPITLETNFTVNQNLSLRDLHLAVDGAVGQINRPDLFDDPVPFTNGHVVMNYGLAPEKLELGETKLDFGGVTISANGAVTNDNGDFNFDIGGGTNDISIDDFRRYWPKTVSVGGRNWVTKNISHGKAQATYHITGKLPQKNIDEISITEVSGTIKVTDAIVHYFGQLPVVDNAAADITYDQHEMKIAMKSGHTQNLAITDGGIVIFGLDKSDQSIAIDLALNGPISTALRIIDSDPLHYAKKLKIDPASVDGIAQTKLHMGFPLLNDLLTDQIDLTASSTLTGLGIKSLVQSHSLTDTNASLKLNIDGVDLDGKGTLDQLPIIFQLRENFRHQNGLDSDINVQATLNDADRERFGLEAIERLAGPTATSLHYRDFGVKSSADILADLTNADFKIDEIGYDKPIGKPGKALGTLSLVADKLVSIDNILVTAPDFKASGSAKLDPDTGHLQTLLINDIRTGATKASVQIRFLPKGDEIDIKGSVLDAGPLLFKKRNPETTKSNSQPDNNPTLIKFNIDHLVTSPDHQADQFIGTLSLIGNHWANASFQMQTKGQSVSLTYGPDGQTIIPLKLRVYAADTGALLSALSLTDTMRGGILHIDGKKEDIAASPAPLNGTFQLDSFALIKAPVLARMFNFLSLTGMMETLSGQGIGFDGLTGTYQLTDRSLDIRNGKLRGPSLGMTIEGNANRDQSTLDLQGTLVPAYTVNQFLNDIPVLGPLLTGGEGQGLFAAAYHITGPFDKPDVSVNPLSVLTPGFLRNLFFEHSMPAEVK